MSESMWIERAQNAEARLVTIEQAYRPALEKVKHFKANFGIIEHSSGEIQIDYEKFVTNLGPEACLELRGVIDAIHQISGEAGKKPHMKLVNG